MKNKQDLEGLFEVDGSPLVQDSIHAIMLGPSLMKMMVIKYDERTHESTWVSPGLGEPLGVVLDSRNLRYEEARPSGKRCLVFSGEQVQMGNFPYESLTSEQKRIHDDWHAEAEKAGFGGYQLG